MPQDRADAAKALKEAAACVSCLLTLVRLLRRLELITPELEDAAQTVVDELNFVEDDIYPMLEDL